VSVAVARDPAATRRRLLAAAARCFADRGFHGTTIREIAQRAKVNVAAGNYHFGSKKELYLEVLRGEFTQAKIALQAGGASPTPAELDALDRDGLVGVLHARAEVMLRLMIGPPPGLYGTLMQREMADPSEALPIIVDEFIRPWMAELRAIIARLEPTLDDDTVERCAMSVVGQALFFRASMPVILRIWKLRAYSPALRDSLAEHIADFSVGGMAHRARGRPRTSRAR
jgi:TetR/AcrR family transcriptional regulator, regulator of cefoperazone and chloramphenicol sensitivity